MSGIDTRHQELAELIAEGEAKRALDMLHELHPDTLRPAHTLRLVAHRRAEAARLAAVR